MMLFVCYLFVIYLLFAFKSAAMQHIYLFVICLLFALSLLQCSRLQTRCGVT